MQFRLMFKHTYKKQFGNILCIYESDQFYLEITKDRGEFFCVVFNKELNKRAELKDFTNYTDFPEVLEVNLENISFYKTEVSAYIRQCINSRGLNVEFTRNTKPLGTLLSVMSIILLGFIITTFLFDNLRTILIIIDVFLFITTFILLLRYGLMKALNQEIEYFSELRNKNILDELYLLQKEMKLKPLFEKTIYLGIRINQKLRPELEIAKCGRKNNLLIVIDDDYVKCAVVNKKTEQQDFLEEEFIVNDNKISSIEDIIKLINSIDIEKTTRMELSEIKGINNILIEFSFESNIKRSIRRNYMPHLVVNGDKEYLGIRFYDACKEKDNIITAKVECLYPGVNYSKLKPQTTFKIMEGGTIIARGKVLDILDSRNDKSENHSDIGKIS